LELFLENFVMGQQKKNQELKNQTGFWNDSIIKLTSKSGLYCYSQQNA